MPHVHECFIVLTWLDLIRLPFNILCCLAAFQTSSTFLSARRWLWLQGFITGFSPALGDFDLGPSPNTTPTSFSSTGIALITVYRRAGWTRVTVCRLPIRKKSVYRHFCLRFKMSGKCAKTLSLHSSAMLCESTALFAEAVYLSPSLHSRGEHLQKPGIIFTDLLFLLLFSFNQTNWIWANTFFQQILFIKE